MPDFFRKFDSLKNEVQQRLSGSDPHHQPHHHQSAFPGRASPLQPYWTAAFNPSIPVAQEWRHETGASGWGNNELQNYTTSDQNSFFRPTGAGGGCLVVRAIVSENEFTSARLTSHVSLGRDRGYLQARITAASARGVWPAFWLLPTEPFNWPRDGEIDIMESWNDARENHSCLHWGHYNGPDHDKHRVIDTHVGDVENPHGHLYGFAWDQRPDGSGGLIWYIDGRPVMKAGIPGCMRRIRDFQVKFNIAMGGNVMQGVRPADGVYEMVVHEVGLFEAPPQGWDGFERDMSQAPEGRMM